MSQVDPSHEQFKSTDPVKVKIKNVYCKSVKCIVSKALVNVPALTERTLRRDIAALEFTTTAEIQVLLIFY